MTVLHAVWSDGHLLLWGERPLTGGRLPQPRGRAPVDGRARRHPYAVRRSELLDAAGHLTGLEHLDALRVTETEIVLPTSATSPLPSPGLPGASDVGEDARSLRSWRVDAIEVAGADALDLLLAIPTDPPPDARPGASLHAAATVASLALELAARGRVVPGLVQRAGRYEGRWLPVVGPAERRRLAALVPALPPALLAAAGETERPAGTVLREVVEQLVDAACRCALTDQHAGTPARRPGGEAAWVRALTDDDPVVDHADVDELRQLAEEVAAWHQSGQQAAALRAAFRLSPPSDSTEDADEGQVEAPEGWRLELALQAADDPSLIVLAADLWRSPTTQGFLDRTLESPEERLLGDLGRAARLYPALDRALGAARPEALELDLDEVIAFVGETAGLLEQAGFGVLVPEELRHPTRLGARLRTSSRSTGSQPADGSGLLGYEGIVDYRWEVAIGDQSLTEQELAELARLKAPLVRLRGRWVHLGEEDLAAAVRLLAEQPGGEMTVAEAARLGLGVAEADTDLDFAGVAADGPLGALLEGDADPQLEALPTPDRLEGQLRPYQERGLAWLAFLESVGLGGCLADDMGLGKSIQLLALLLHERSGITRRSKRWPAPTLLICPMSIVGNWQREAARFAPSLRVLVHHGPDRVRGEDLAAEARRADLVLTTYHLAARDQTDLTTTAWRRIALDEAQNIKNPAARQSRAIRALDAPSRLALTGTPVENRLTELWSIMDFCNPGLLGNQKVFRERFAVPIEKLHDDDAAERLRRITQPFVLRRTKTDRSIITDLPDKLEFDEACRLTREQGSLYAAVVEDMLQRIEETEGIERRGLVLQTMLRLKQVCNHPAHLLGDGSPLPGRSGKLDRLEEVVDEVLASGEKVLVFTQFARWGGRMQRHLRERLGRDVLFLHGGMSKAERDRTVAAFQADGGPSVFLLSLKAGGVGLNLTAASHVVHFDRWWNPAVEDQATDRAFRIGQRRDVVVRKLVCAGTLEERIAALIEHKKDLAERVVGAGESWLTELSTDELREVIALGSDAVVEDEEVRDAAAS
ncbi:DEAD/DEAH box helicase [Nitriliruptor alkaliphilus]|uniref:DEAD/DEAH box helicase n=1 Tax=Nitriliruptor alkaliphilus TaxID=427918 RepID=UPI000696A80E|nr:DEAD/DEAH box helicase [Nitriliruptor alkaliphilus]